MEETRGKKVAATFALIVNVILFASKLVGGILGRSSVLVADSLDSLTDFVGDIIILSGIWIAGKPPDKKHPYGHYKAESIVTAVVGIIIVASATVMMANNIISLVQGEFQTPAKWTLFIAIISIIGCVVTYLYLTNKSKQYSSPALEAGALHKLADALTSVAAAAGISLSVFFGVKWGDSVASIVVAIWVIRTGIKIIFRGGHELLDGAPDDNFKNQISNSIAAVPGVERVIQMRMRTAGGKVFIHADISVSSQLSISDAHIIAHRVRDKIISEYSRLADVVIHTEPCQFTENIQEDIADNAKQILTETDEIQQFHGLNVLTSKKGFIIIVDIVVNPEITVREAHIIADNLHSKLTQIHRVEDAIIHIDYTTDD